MHALKLILMFAIIMNAQECRTLTATCMHDSSTCRSIACLNVYNICLLNIRSIELDTYPAPEVLLFSSESVHDIARRRGKAPVYVTESLCDY